jgi:hypothetical protein
MKALCKTDPTMGGYLQKSDAVWATCLTNAAATGYTLGDSVYMKVGKALITGVYYLWQSFLRFDLSSLPASADIQSCILRLYIHTDESDTDFSVRAYPLNASFGTFDATDWEAAGTYGCTVSTTDVATDSDGNKYMDFEWSSDQLGTLSTTNTTYDVRLEGTNESVAPTGDVYLKCYGSTHSTLRPYLKIVYRDLREQIIAAVIDELAAIDEDSTGVPGYNTTPKSVTSVWEAPTLLGPEAFPLIYVDEVDETRPQDTFTTEQRTMAIRLLGVVYDEAKANLRAAVNELLRDIEKALEADVGSTTRLGITQVEGVEVVRVRTPANYLIDDNRAYGFVDMAVTYRHTMNES